MASFASCGCEPCPLLPWTVIYTSSADVVTEPFFSPTLPNPSSVGRTCIARNTSTSSTVPESMIARAPPGCFSSLASKINLTVPANSSRISARIFALPSIIAVCRSWPHACMTPLFSLENGRPVASRTGSASISHLMPIHLPLPFRPFTTPITEVPSGASISSTPYFASCSLIREDVLISSFPSSGWRWISRLISTMSSKTASAFAKMVSNISLPPFLKFTDKFELSLYLDSWIIAFELI